MSDVLELSAALRQSIEALGDAKKTRGEIQRLRSVKQALDDVAGDVRRSAEFLAALRADGYRVGTVPTSLRVARLAQSLVEAPDPDSERLATSVAELRNELTQMCRRLEDTATEAWRSLVASFSIEDKLGLFQTLRMIPTFRDRADDLIHRATVVRAELSQQRPPSAAAYRNLRRNFAALENEITQLKVADLPGLEEFLRKCARSEATLKDLREQPQILDWIVSQGLEAHFLLRPK